MVILTALLAVPLNMTTIIYTNSQVAMNGINGILKTDNTRLIFKIVYNSILSVIKQLILTKGLDFRMIKVKGHSGEVYNDQADLLAKEAEEQVREGTLGLVN